MAHQWHRGVLTTSSWHGLEEVGVMPTADDMIQCGYSSGAWPVELRRESLVTSSGLIVDKQAIVADYAIPQMSRAHGVASLQYAPTPPAEWAELMRAAVCAGAQPTGAFALQDGTRALATFQVGIANGLRTQLLIVDSFDGSKSLQCGTTSVRVVCANTLSAAMSADSGGMARIRHIGDMESKINMLRESIGIAIKQGEKVRSVYEAAEHTRLNRSQADEIFDKLFPPAPEGASKYATSLAANARNEARIAATMPINNAGNSVATLWNAATYLVDRNADGSARKTSGDKLNTMLFGARATRVEEIKKVIEIVMNDGSIREMTVLEARDCGVSERSLAEQFIADAMN